MFILDSFHLMPKYMLIETENFLSSTYTNENDKYT